MQDNKQCYMCENNQAVQSLLALNTALVTKKCKIHWQVFIMHGFLYTAMHALKLELSKWCRITNKGHTHTKSHR